MVCLVSKHGFQPASQTDDASGLPVLLHRIYPVILQVVILLPELPVV